MDPKLKALLTTLCQNNVEKVEGGEFMIPHLATVNVDIPRKEDPKVTDKFFVNPVVDAKQFDERLEQIWLWINGELKDKYGIERWDQTYEGFSAILREIFYNGQGFLVPYLGAYVNEEPEKQRISGFLWVPTGYYKRSGEAVLNPVPITDFDDDQIFEMFTRTLWNKLGDYEVVLRAWKKAHSNQLDEKTQELNEGDTGKKILASTFERQIEELIRKEDNLKEV